MGGGAERRPGGSSLTSEASTGGPPSAPSAPGKRTLTDAAGVDGIPGNVRVTAEHGLRVRKTPESSSHANVLGLLHRNAEIEAHGVRGAWLDIFYRAEPAVIHGGFVEPVRPASHGPTAPAHAAPTPSHDHAPASEHGPLDAHEHAAVVSNGHVPPAPHAAPAPPPGGHPTTAITAAPQPATPPAPPHSTGAASPSPSPSPSSAPSPHSPTASAPTGGTTAAPPPPPAPTVPRKPGEFFQRIYTAGSGKNTQQVAVFASPGVTAQPNLFMMLHGHDAQLGIDHDADHQGKAGVLSGIDVAAETTREAVNTISLVPQGWIGGAGDRDKHEGGYMRALEGGLPAFLDSLLPQVAKDLGLPALTPAHIGLAGHSAGGYKGINESLGAAGGLADAITDVTLMDTDYAPSHFETTARWLLRKPAEGKPHTTKTLRISESRDQMTAAAAKGFEGAVQVFGDAHFRARAEKAGFTFVSLGTGEQHGSHNVARTHFQLHLQGQVHADVLLLESNRGAPGHHQVRDDILDDSILTVGKGAGATAGYGSETIEGHGAKSLAGLSAAPSGNAAATPGASAATAPTAQSAQAAHAPAKVVHVSEADLHGAVTKAAKPADPAGAAPAPAHEGPTDEHHGLAGPKVAAAITADHKANPPPTIARPTQDWVHDTSDATSMMTPRTKALYDKAMETLRAGNLIFPAEDEPAPKTSKPFKAFVASLYGQFGVVERRINNDIMGHGGGKAYSMKGFIESTLADLPRDAIAPDHGRQRMNREMLAAFLKMRDAAAQDGVALLAISCYREPKANATSKNHYAVATNSSHGYGLAVDLELSVDASHTAGGKAFRVSEVNTHDPANLMKYYQSSVMKWMAQNGQKFDFHPYFNEPWHFEYNPEGMAAKMVDGAKAWKQQHTEA